MDSQLALQITNLKIDYKVYEGTLKVVQHLDMYLSKSEKIGIIGEAGSGKTSVLKAIVSVLRSPPAILSFDKIEVYGTSITSKEGLVKLRKQVAMIFQDPSSSLNPTLKISSQMKDILKSQFPNHNNKDYHDRMVSSLKSVSMPALERVLDSYPVQLSGGMKQRVCIAMALMKDSELIIADEPTTALDVTIEEQILELIDDLVTQRQKSLVIVSHALGAVRKMTDRVYVIYAGNVVETAPTKEYFLRPRHPYSIGLLAATPKLTGEGISDGIAGDIPDYINPPSGCRFAERCNLASGECYDMPPLLRVTKENPLWSVACHHADMEDHRG